MNAARQALRIGAVAFSLGVAGLVGTGGMGAALAAPDDSNQSSASSSSESTGSSSTTGTGSGSSGGAVGASTGTNPVTSSGAGLSATKPARGSSLTRPTRSSFPARPSRDSSANRPARDSAAEPPSTSAPAEQSATDSANKPGAGPETSVPATAPDGDESGTPSTSPLVPVDGSVAPTPPIVSEAATEPKPGKRRSDRGDTDSSADAPHRYRPTAAAVGATRTNLSGSDVGDRSPTHGTDSGATDIAVSRSDNGAESVTETGTRTLNIDLSLPAGVNADTGSAVVAQTADTVPSATAVDVMSGLLSVVGLGLPLSATDGPVAPPPAVVLMGSLDLVRRDLERMSDGLLAGDTQQITANTLTIDAPSNEPVPVVLDGTSESAAADIQAPATTSSERTTAFHNEQAQRIAAFAAEQSARISTFTEEVTAQFAESPLAALIGIPVFVATEVVRAAVFVVAEVVNYVSFAVTEFFHALSDVFNPPIGGGGGAGGDGMYGDPVKNAQYWQAQSYENCVLMATTMVIGQLTGSMPTEEEINKLAMETQSVVDVDRKMYLGGEDRVHVQDAVALLDRNYGITATITRYDKEEGAKALDAMTMALASQKAVMVGLHAPTIWNAVENKPLPEGVLTADHQVVILGVDRTKGIVYINDSGFSEEGKNMKVPLDVFMKAWQADDYETVVAERKAQDSSASAPESASISGSGVLVSVA